MEHVRLFSEEGYAAEITSYTYNEEYLAAFGLDQVPYNRAMATTPAGEQSTINEPAHWMLALLDLTATRRLASEEFGTDSVPA